MAAVFSFLFRLVLLAAGLLMAASIAVAVAVLISLWLVRAAWARLTGQAVAPFVVNVHPRQGFESVYRRSGEASPTPRADAVSPRRAIGDITDVEPR